MKDLARREKNPATVPPEEGWSPYRAREFLITDGLVPGDYHQDPFDEAEWFASSPYLEIGRAIIPNNVAYYVEGDEHVARRLKLIVQFNDPESADESRERFVGVARQLIRKALDQEMPAELRAAIMAETSTSFAIDGKTAELVRQSWLSGRGHELRLYLRGQPDAVAKRSQ